MNRETVETLQQKLDTVDKITQTTLFRVTDHRIYEGEDSFDREGSESYGVEFEVPETVGVSPSVMRMLIDFDAYLTHSMVGPGRFRVQP